MDKKVQEFIEKYKEATNTEYNIFLAQADIDMSNGKEARIPITELKEQFKAQRQELQNIQLTPAQAKEILKQSDKFDNVGFTVDAIDGPDCYRFMNQGIKSNPEVASLAYKGNRNSINYFPDALKEQMAGFKPNEVFSFVDKGATISKAVEVLKNTKNIAKSFIQQKPRERTFGDLVLA